MKRATCRFRTLSLFTVGIVGLLLACNGFAQDQKIVQVLATSDAHGRFLPYDYALNQPNEAGSMAQIATAVFDLRSEYIHSTIVVDAGDFAQDNSQYLFVNQSNPMIEAMNFIGYDVITLGNHEFNQGVPALQHMMAQFKHPDQVLCGNVYTPEGRRLYPLSTVITTANEVAVGFIGLCTPNITRWDAAHLKGYRITDPQDELEAAVAELKDTTDILIALIHMGEQNEYGTPNSGVEDIATGAKGIDLILCGHAHENIDDHYYYKEKIYQADELTDVIRENGILIVEPGKWAHVLSRVLFMLTREGTKYVIKNRATDIVATNLSMQTEERTISSDIDLVEELKPFHEKALANAARPIGELSGGPLVPPDEIPGIFTARIQPTAMIQLINEAQQYYGSKIAGRPVDVSAVAAFRDDANIPEGEISYSDVSLIYKYDNTLYVIEMTGAQLKRYMEWGAAYFNQVQPEDLTLSFNPDIWPYNYDMFGGISYEVDISKPAGKRIGTLKRPDGSVIEDSDKLLVALNNYRADTHLLSPGAVFEQGEALPAKIATAADKGDYGNGRIRDFIASYITDVKKGKISNDVEENWMLTGFNPPKKLHAIATDAIVAGIIDVFSEGYPSATRPVTVSELKELGLMEEEEPVAKPTTLPTATPEPGPTVCPVAEPAMPVPGT